MKIENTLDASAGCIKMLVAAEAGNGKTTLAKTIQDKLNEKVLVISAEAGLLSLRGSNVDFIELQNKWDDATKAYLPVPKSERINRLLEIYQFLMLPETMKKYTWIFIDSLTEINQNMQEFLDSQEDYQGPKNTLKKFGELNVRMRSVCKTFRDMPHYSVVFSALVKNDIDSDNKSFMKIDMTGKFADALPALFDEIFYLGVLPEVDDGGRNIRKILTQKTDKILFPKDRSGQLDRFEPADLGSIVLKIRKTNVKPIVSDISGAAKALALDAALNRPPMNPALGKVLDEAKSEQLASEKNS